MARLLVDNPGIAVGPRDIYNERQRDSDTTREGKTRTQHLLEILPGHEYRVKFALSPRNQLTHLFFALNEALEIFKKNSDVVLMDCTYKPNRFDMPLLNMTSITGINTTIHLAQAFLRSETVDDYTWVLTELKQTLEVNGICLPQVIFVNRDLALLNALENVFQGVPVQLCLWHIVKMLKHMQEGTHSHK